MNKYEGAIDRVARYCSDYRVGVYPPRNELTNELTILFELVNKATPKKPIYLDFEEDDDGEVVIANKAKCPTCGYEFEFGTWNDYENHHCVCGQKIDWSDYE